MNHLFQPDVLLSFLYFKHIWLMCLRQQGQQHDEAQLVKTPQSLHATGSALVTLK